MGNVLAELISWTKRQPDKMLYAFLDMNGEEAIRYTYAGFLDRVNVIGGHLASRFPAQSRVLLAYPAGLEMICAFFGCLRAGLIPVPVPAPARHGFGTALYRLEHVARDCHAKALLTDQEGDKLIRAGIAGTSSRGFLAGAPTVSSLELIMTDEFLEFDGPVVERPASDVLFLQYTSGSTSFPKGVMVGNDNVLANARLVLDHDSPVAVSWLPQHHDMGLIGLYLNTAIGGGSLYGFSPSTFIQRPSLWLDAMSRYRATASSAPNFAYEYCLRPGRVPAAVRERLDLSSVKVLIAGAEPIKPTVYQGFLKSFAPHGLDPSSFVVAYGLAENTLAVSSYGRNTLSVSRLALGQGLVRQTSRISSVGSAMHIQSCGKALGDNKLAIVDPDKHVRLDEGRVGEIWVTGGSKCLGYWNNADVSAATFGAKITNDIDDADPDYLRTGDLGFLHDGELYVCGRRKDMLIVHGQNFYPQDIEAVVEQTTDAVRKSCVAAFEVNDGMESAVAVVAEVGSLKTMPDTRAILDAVRDQLNLPIDRIVYVAPKSLPKTSSGKLMRHLVKQMLAEGKLPPLGEYVRKAAVGGDHEPDTSGEPFAFFKSKYGLKGDEDFSLLDAGLDSLDLVLLLHEIGEVLAEHGATDIGAQVDIRLVQELTVAELFRLGKEFERDSKKALARVRKLLPNMARDQQKAEQKAMKADRKLKLRVRAPAAPANAGPPQTVFMTGGTGFLGPFLLDSLLQQTDASVHVLVRAADAASARERLRRSVATTAPRDKEYWEAFEERVVAHCGDLEKPELGLAPGVWDSLAQNVDTIYHNGATVNYLFAYHRMRAANVLGTMETLKLAATYRPKTFNFLSTTFIFGWNVKPLLLESDSNEKMQQLDFGYSQSKWVSEQLVGDALRNGMAGRIFRPSLITPSSSGEGSNLDITLRLLAFMLKHGVGVDALNQISFVPADVTANNIVAIANMPETSGGSFHVTRDDYVNMIDVTNVIEKLTGRKFDLFDMRSFIPELVRRCTREDPLFPLLDFLVNSVDKLERMAHKRYDSTAYQRARDASPWGIPDASMEDTMAGILRFLRKKSLSYGADVAPQAATPRLPSAVSLGGQQPDEPHPMAASL